MTEKQALRNTLHLVAKSSPEPLFRLVVKTIHGSSVTSSDPKLDAYKAAAYIASVLLRKYLLTFHACGCVTCKGAGLEPMTFVKAGTHV